MEFYEEHFEPKTFELGLIDREIFANTLSKTSKNKNLDFHLFTLIDFF